MVIEDIDIAGGDGVSFPDLLLWELGYVDIQRADIPCSGMPVRHGIVYPDRIPGRDRVCGAPGNRGERKELSGGSGEGGYLYL